MCVLWISLCFCVRLPNQQRREHGVLYYKKLDVDQTLALVGLSFVVFRKLSTYTHIDLLIKIVSRI